MCKKIHRGGNAEQYYADKKYKEAVAEAVEACAEDTKGQTCYICTQALHWKTKEGLVRGCSCRGTAGFAHVSCLAEQAKILYAEAEENNLGWEVKDARLKRWYACSLCEQNYHGVVQHALGWACWKTYVGRPETDEVRGNAMTWLANGLSSAGHMEGALSVRETDLSVLRRLGGSPHNMLIVQGNIANAYDALGRLHDSMRMTQEVYSGWLRLKGEEHENTIMAAHNHAASLIRLQRHAEAKALLRKIMPVARRVLGAFHRYTLGSSVNYARALYSVDGATLDDLREAVTTLEETTRTARRVLGGAHPTVVHIEGELHNARATLDWRESSSRSK